MYHQILFLIEYVLLFFASGLVHVALYGVPFTDSSAQLLYGSIAFLWGFSIVRRIMDARVRKLILGIIALSELFFLLQICNYKLFTESVALKRYCWYAYYTPMILIPLLLLFLALYLNQPPEKKLSRLWLIPAVLMVLIAVGFITNDLHFLAFRFLEPVMHTNAKKAYGILYNGYIVGAILCSGMAFSIMLWKCRVTITRRLAWVPVVPLGLGVTLLLLNLIGKNPRINGVSLWNMGEIYFFMSIGFLESCIRIGLIPANTEYDTIFRQIGMQARIYDMDGNERFASGKKESEFIESDQVLLEQNSIPGGSVVWAVDVKTLKELDRQIEETTEQIEARNEYLRSENELKEEYTAVAARNNLYDTIATLLKPQLDRIQSLLKEAEAGGFTENLKMISVLNAYIKRRSNMTLLLHDSMSAAGKEAVGKDDARKNDAVELAELPLAELALALKESLSYLELCGTQTFLLGNGMRAEIKLPAEMITTAYDFYETVVEEILPNITALTVTVNGLQKNSSQDDLLLRLMYAGREIPDVMSWRPEVLERFGGTIEVLKEGVDRVITLRMKRGGEAS